MPLTHEDLTFLARLAKSPDGKYLQRIYAARLGEVEAKLRVGEGAAMHRSQGRAQELDDLMQMIDKADEWLQRGVPTQSQGLRRVTNSSATDAPYRNLS